MKIQGNTEKLKSLHAWLQRHAPFHFVGIGGSGMAPLAKFTRSFGITVTGSDQSHEAAQIAIDDRDVTVTAEGEASAGVLATAKTIIYSSAIRGEHPDLKAARERGLRILHRSELLAHFTKAFKTITVAGTHGKTTTSAMIAHMLEACDLSPSWLVGASFANGWSACHRGESDLLVVEADESDGTFLRYSPYIAVVTNIDSDHLDFYGTPARLEDVFLNHMNSVDEQDGVVVLGWDNEPLRRLSEKLMRRKLTFGSLLGSEVRLYRRTPDRMLSLMSVVVEHDLVEFALPLPGHHNALNALACLAVGRSLGISLGDSTKALSKFPGVKRRMEQYQSESGALIFDDYAHNPGKIAGCLAGLKEAFPDRRLLVVFQPHRFSRVRTLYQEFVSSFEHADHVIVTPIYAAGEDGVSPATSAEMAKHIEKHSHVRAEGVESLDACVAIIRSLLSPNKDVVLTVGAGDVWTVARAIANHQS